MLTVYHPEEVSSVLRQTFEIPLDIPDVTIDHVTTNRMSHIEITVKSTLEGTPCRQCGQMATKFYGEDREIRLRHLPILGRQTGYPRKAGHFISSITYRDSRLALASSGQLLDLG